MRKLILAITFLWAFVCLFCMGIAYYSFLSLQELESVELLSDQGVATFVPKRVEMRQETPLHRYNKTSTPEYKKTKRTYYYVIYQDDAKYRYEDRFVTEEAAREVLKAKEPLERRIIGVKNDDGSLTKAYYTCDASLSVEQFVSERNMRDYLRIGFALLVVAGFFVFRFTFLKKLLAKYPKKLK